MPGGILDFFLAFTFISTIYLFTRVLYFPCVLYSIYVSSLRFVDL